LYTKIGQICDLDDNTIVLDICCGTGTIGLTLAKVKNLLKVINRKENNLEKFLKSQL
jgi:tRNA1(Val) A37 N6-methylase TrmN6